MDIFAQAEKATEEEEEEEEEDPDAEPEDDFNAAWEVLELARAIFEKHKEESSEAKLKLADTYMSLGDVSLETGSSTFSTRVHHIALTFYQKNSNKRSKITQPGLVSSKNSCQFPLAILLRLITASASSWT